MGLTSSVLSQHVSPVSYVGVSKACSVYILINGRNGNDEMNAIFKLCIRNKFGLDLILSCLGESIRLCYFI